MKHERCAEGEAAAEQLASANGKTPARVSKNSRRGTHYAALTNRRRKPPIRGAKIREQRDSFERSEIGVPAGKIYDFLRGAISGSPGENP